MAKKKKEKDVSVRFAAVRIWVNRTTTETGYADVLVPAGFIDETFKMQACDDQAFANALSNEDCIEWCEDEGNADLDIESIDSLKLCDGEAEVTHVLFPDKDNTWQCIPAERIRKHAEIRKVPNDTN